MTLVSRKNPNKAPKDCIFDEKFLKSVESDLKIHARALGIPSGAAESFIQNSLESTKKSLKRQKLITNADFTRRLSRELQKYHPDLAYVYENYDKII